MLKLVYVDDIILASDSTTLIDSVKKFLDTAFHIKDLGSLKYFLGIEIARNKEGLFLFQRKYVLELLADTGQLGSKPVTTPMDCTKKLSVTDTPLLNDPSSYRKIIGKLLYLTITRPDISYSVHVLSQFLSCPAQSHFDAAIRILKYLKGNPGQGLFYSSSSSLVLSGFTNSYWASCIDTRRSTSGYCMFLGNSMIFWKNKKQSVVSKSSAEAEYMEMSFAACEIIWLLSLLSDFGITFTSSVALFSDSKSALALAANPVHHERTKHIEIDCHYIREQLQKGLIHLLHVYSCSQLADIFTKALSSATLNGLLGKMGVLSIYSPS